MKGDVEEIMKNVLDMRGYLATNPPMSSVLETFKEFKENCPKLFEMVLENKSGYFEELQNMVAHVRRVNSGEASLSDATKVVKNIYDNKYIYPIVSSNSGNLSLSQREETREYVRNQQLEVERLEAKWAKRMESSEEDESDYER